VKDNAISLTLILALKAKKQLSNEVDSCFLLSVYVGVI
jgi:hypothetical protein